MQMEKGFEDIFYYHDHKILVKCAKIEIILPIIYFDKSIATIEEDVVETLGIFDFYVYRTGAEGEKGEKYFQQYASNIKIKPNSMSIKGKGDDRYYSLELVEGDAMMASTIIAQDPSTVKRFIQLLFSGYMPDSLGYDEISDSWDMCLEINGGSMPVSEPIKRLGVAGACRNKNDLSEPFRHLLKRKPDTPMTDRKIIRIDDMPRYNSSMAALTSADPKQSMTVAVVRNRTGKKSKGSPIEKAIM